MLRSRPVRQASDSQYWPNGYHGLTSPDSAGIQRSLSWSEGVEDSPKRVHLRRSFPDLHNQRKRNKRILVLCCLTLLCLAFLWIVRSVHVITLYNPSKLLSLSTYKAILHGDVVPTHEAAQTRIAEIPNPPPATTTVTKTWMARFENQHVTDGRNNRWPPLVTAIPETRLEPDSVFAGLTSSSIDAQFCGGVSPCRILLPLWIGEQESRSRMHLLQVLELATALNRTLVLPNVGRSRIGACGRWEFEVYYDIASFVGPRKDEDRGRVRKVMLMDDFKTWLEMRPTGPAGQVLFVDEMLMPGGTVKSMPILSGETATLDISYDDQPIELEDNRLRKTRCIGTRFRQVRLAETTPMTIHLPLPEEQRFTTPGEIIAETLRQQEATALGPTPEVLVLHWDMRHFPYNNLLENIQLDYSSHLHTLARRLLPSNRKYIAVHWRMETVSPALLPDCAEALVDTLFTLLSDPTLAAGINTVWFASDFPWPVSSSAAEDGDALDTDTNGDQQGLMQIETSARRSNTFRSVSKGHIEAIGILKSAFRKGGPLDGWRLTGISEELDRVRRNMEGEGKMLVLQEEDDEGVLLEDAGILGILDKLAAMNATLFVSGARRCGRVSSFTKQITDHRAKLQLRGEHAPANVVDMFG
ncbi:hypothetical protein K474DRAFT_1657201 [Panus rudis PR-1116 ss-1]|nr:hypothetical protein K474DRAFT_1657201 [Panus rudis PR-1116 ss-1]